MQDINSWTGIGRLTRDSELTVTQNQTACLKFSVAVNSSMGKGKEDHVSFFNIVVWGSFAQTLSSLLTKGSQVVVQGELRQNRFQDKNGQNRSDVSINARSVQLVGGKKIEGNNQPQSNQPQNNQPTGNVEFKDFNQSTLSDDEVPF